ncbi:hypothetical protein F5144DRAFT_139970 [Chaetomium tenue]|uniref:Uncharacterized protein n=1 Tax=Chaetomium tenue TaxID=1854479 RepID=A0ACB7PI28_9PEZI|nr:hypothetical protein F5144DRAFT_139970 [Chaetomium globosum]
MHLTTTLTTLLLTTLTFALPTTTHHEKKEPAAAAAAAAATCAHIHPLSTPRLNLLNRPDLGLLSTQTLTFILPAPSPGTSLPGPCTLRAVFPPHWAITDSSVQAGGPPLAVNVYAVDGPAAGALVGTSRFAAEAGSGAGAAERVVVVNSFACRPRMTYRFELAGTGQVAFVNGLDQGLGVEGGLEMAVGC